MRFKRRFTTEKVPPIPPGTKEAIGQSERFLLFQEQLSRAAPVDRPVLLAGERGTGKELAATRLHFLSKRWQGPMITLNCAALSASLIESELFGYEKGAFTGAEQRRRGRFEAADGGTLFLDEISSIPVQVQEKILRVVEYGTFERVGSSESLEVDVRILGATNQDLVSLAKQGRFKEDLLDRLCFEVLYLPPLRERHGDIALLATHFAGRMAMEVGREEIPQFSEEASRSLEDYPWPGNIRELKNIVERAVYRSESSLIETIDFHPFRALSTESILPPRGESPIPSSVFPGLGEKPFASFEKAVEAFKISLIAGALKSSRFNQHKAAKTLGLTYHQFRGLFRKYREIIEKTENKIRLEE